MEARITFDDAPEPDDPGLTALGIEEHLSRLEKDRAIERAEAHRAEA